MKTLKRILFVALALIGILIALAYTFPRNIMVERTVTIQAPVEVVFQQINVLKNWEGWSPWHRLDSAMTIVYEGPAMGAGASYRWSSTQSQVGNGSLTITESIPFSLIKSEMNFMESSTGYGSYIFEKAGDGTKLTWRLESDLGNNPVARYFGLLMPKMLGADFEAGLKNIHDIVMLFPNEKQGLYTISEGALPEMICLTIRTTCKPQEISQFLDTSYPLLHSYAGKHKVNVIGYPISVYYFYSEEKVEMLAAVSIDKLISGDGHIEPLIIVGQKAVIAEYTGDFSINGHAHEAIDVYMSHRNLSLTGGVVEVYLSEIDDDIKERKCIIYYPTGNENVLSNNE